MDKTVDGIAHNRGGTDNVVKNRPTTSRVVGIIIGMWKRVERMIVNEVGHVKTTRGRILTSYYVIIHIATYDDRTSNFQRQNNRLEIVKI